MTPHDASVADEEDVVNSDAVEEEVTMAEKSPRSHNSKKVGKSLKEKRNEKHAKKESRKGSLGA